MSRKGNCWDTQFTMQLNAQSNLSQAGIGVIAFALTCRNHADVIRREAKRSEGQDTDH